MDKILIGFIQMAIDWFDKEGHIKTRAKLIYLGKIQVWNWKAQEGIPPSDGIVTLFMEYYDKDINKWRGFINLNHSFNTIGLNEVEIQKAAASLVYKIISGIGVAGVWQHFVATRAQELRNAKIEKPKSTILAPSGKVASEH